MANEAHAPSMPPRGSRALERPWRMNPVHTWRTFAPARAIPIR
jgi:hypothetical protein